MPVTRLNMPNAVPRRSAGAASATSVRKDALGEAHVQAPQSTSQAATVATFAAKASDEIGGDQHRKAAGEQPKRPNRSDSAPAGQADERVDHVHHHQHPRHQRQRQPDRLRAQQQERLAEARQREQRARARRRSRKRGRGAPICARARGDAPAQARAGRSARAPRGRSPRTTGTPARPRSRTPAEVVGGQHHQRDRQQRPEERADRVERLPQTEARAAHVGRRDVGDQRIARCAADALADAVDEARREQPADRWARAGTPAW